MSAYRTAPYRDPRGLQYHGHCFPKGLYPLYEFTHDSLVVSHEVDDWAPPKFIVDGKRAPFPLFSVVHPGEPWPPNPGKTPDEKRRHLIKEYGRIRKVVTAMIECLDLFGRRHRGHLIVGFYEGQDELPGLAWSPEPLVADVNTKASFPAWWYPREAWLPASG